MRRLLGAFAAGLLSCAPALAQDAIWGVRLGGLAADLGVSNGYDVAAIPGGNGDFYVCGGTDDPVQFVFGAGTPYEIVIPRNGGQRADAFLARYRSDGTPVWVRIGRGNGLDRAMKLRVFDDGSVVVTGSFNESTSGPLPTGIIFDGGTAANVAIATNQTFKSFMVRYTAAGDLQFARQVVIGGSSDSVADVVTLPSGGFVLVGYFRGGTFGDANDPHPIPMPLGGSVGVLSSDGFVARYQQNGDIVWVERVESAAGDSVSAAARMPDGDLILTCEIGRRDLPATLFPGHPAALSLPIDPQRSAYVLRLDVLEDAEATTGVFLISWIHAIGASGGDVSRRHVIDRGPGDELYLAGRLAPDPLDSNGTRLPATYDSTYMLPGSASDRFYVVRIAPSDGALLWAVGSTLTSSVSRPCIDIAPTRDGLVFVLATSGTRDLITASGASWGTFTQACHAKVDRDGTPLWVRSDSVFPFGVTTIPGGTAIVTGRALTGAALDTGTPTQIDLGGPLYQCYLARYAVAPATSIEVPGDITRSCDPGVNGATVHFVVDVAGAPGGSRLEVRNATSDTLLASVVEPDGAIGVGPVVFPMGVSAVTARLYDAANALLVADGFLVTVADTTPPVIVGAGPHTIECTGHDTELLRTVLGITATDDCDPEPVLEFAPSSVPHGTTLVTATARDHAGNTSSCSFDVTVVDTLPPWFTVIPADIERECSMPGGAIVTFDVQAEDVCGIASLVCIDETNRTIDPAGTFFEDGVHTVTCTATDPSQNLARTSFQVRIVDNTAPVLIAPSDQFLPNDPGEATAIAFFSVTVTELCDPMVAVTCTAPWGPVRSGDAFPIGTTVVECVAVDHAQNRAEARFSITVYDAEPPSFGGNAGGTAGLVTDCEGRILAVDAAALGVLVEDNYDPDPLVTVAPSALLPGTAVVVVTARDADGNAASTFVTVTVLRGAFDCEVLRPLDPGVDNRIQAGRVVPIKLRVTCEGHEVTDAVATIDAVELLTAGGTPIANETVEDPGASMDGGNVFRLAGSHYHYNLSTASWVASAGARHRVTVRIAKAGHVDTTCEILLVNR